MKTFVISAAVLTAALTVSSPTLAGDADAGKAYFDKKCKTCHSVEPGKHGMGPSLAGVMGRKAASTDFEKYKGLKDMDIVWDADNMDKYLADPKGFVGGSTMFGKIAKAEDRANVIAYMETLK